MLLILMLITTYFHTFNTALIGELGHFYTVKQKVIPSWTAPIPKEYIIRNTTASAHYGFPELNYQYDGDESTKRGHHLEEVEFEPVVNPVRLAQDTGINCDDFTSYAYNCTRDSAFIYNSTNKAPPMPAKIHSWCKAIRRLTNCAIDWNSECKDVTDSHFNEESIKGHMHVVNNICDDDWFLAHYDHLPTCIDRVADNWQRCYIAFKYVVDFEKNRTQEWTHFATHFYLCCARTKFRRCTLDAIFIEPTSKCTHDDAVVLQKFSVIVSEGDVFQDCDKNMLYHNCPGGDPRPPTNLLFKLMNAETHEKLVESTSKNSKAARETLCFVLLIAICLVKLCL